MAVADSVEDGTIPMAEADNLFICVGVFIHWLADDDLSRWAVASSFNCFGSTTVKVGGA